MKTFYLLLIFSFSLFSVTEITYAQWSSNPAVNLTVCDTTGEQALAKIESTADGGCYISWFDNRNGSYVFYLQRLDPLGNKMWASTGLPITKIEKRIANSFILQKEAINNLKCFWAFHLINQWTH